MAGLSFIGSYSGIDQATIDQLMQAERMPLKQLENKKVDITGKRDAWKDINTRLNNLFEKMKALKNVSSFDSKIATSSDDKYVNMTVGTNAVEGKYTIKVDKLATNSSLVGKKTDFGTTADGKPGTVGIKGDFTITNGNKGNKSPIDATINVEEGDTLKDIVDKINKTTKDYKVSEGDEKVTEGSGTGISATIVDNRIVLMDDKTGDRDITVDNGTNNILEKIGLDVMGANTEEGEGADTSWGIQKGNQAEFTLNGIKIYKDTNTISDAIEGVTINLNKVHGTGESDTVTVSTDTEKATKAIQDFVDQYNSTMDFIAEKTAAGDPKVQGSRGVLAGEGSLQRLQASLRKMITDEQEVEGSTIGDISKLGVTTTDKSGKLSFNKEKFLEALEEDKSNVVNFFNSSGVDGKGEKNTGLVDRVNNIIDGFISKKDGLIKSQNESFEKSLKDLATRIENFEARMVKKEAYYVKTFTALDLAMMKAEDQMGWLQGQVDSMNGGR